MNSSSKVISEGTIAQIIKSIEGLRFGCVQVIVHDSQVVAIETTQRIRLAHKAHLTPGGCNNHFSFADQTAGGKRPFVEHNGHSSSDALPSH